MTKEEVQKRIDTLNNVFDVKEICNTDVIKSDANLRNALLLAIVKKGADDYHETIHMCKVMKVKGLL